jgi:hypothetical protein
VGEEEDEREGGAVSRGCVGGVSAERARKERGGDLSVCIIGPRDFCSLPCGPRVKGQRGAGFTRWKG